ncbi:MAG: CapA family protein [Iamia sp.]
MPRSDRPTAAPPTGSATTTTTAPPPDTEVSLAFGGDLLLHLPIVEVARAHGAASGLAHDFGPMLAPMAPVLDGADLALCHLEVPLVADGQAISGYPTFHAPRELATAVEGVGYDGCSTASNHSLDGGLAGVTTTLDTFDLLGLGHAGTARSAEEASGPTFYEVAGARIAHLSYAYGFNGIPLPEGAPWAANQIDPERIAADARAATAFGAQLVVVSLHWGSEYQSDPSADQEALAGVLGNVAEIDLIVGHHAHVVQPIERVGDTWVVYGLGNQLANQPELPRRDGLTVVVTAGGPAGGPLEVRAVEAVPTFVDTATFEVLPVAETLADPALGPERRRELEESARRTMEVVNRRGADVPVHAWT